MLRTRGRALFVVGAMASLVFLSGAAPPDKPSNRRVARWITELGNEDFATRENASRQLWLAGEAAEVALEKALHNRDPEVVRRARDLLDKFRWGIYPDTPADIVTLIHLSQSLEGNANRMAVLKTLLDQGDAGLRAVLKIAAAEKDKNQRKALGNLVAKELPAVFLKVVIEEKYEHFERLLEFGHEGKFVGQTQYSAYWLLRGKLAERIAHFAARLREHPQNKWIAQTLAYLHRANGDLLQARKAAEQSGRDDLVEDILYEMGDWNALAARANGAAKEKPSGKGIHHIAGDKNSAERWAYRAAFARLAGKREKFDNAVRELRKFAKGTEHDYFSAAWKGLLLNDRPTEGLNFLRNSPQSRPLLFDILCARLDFAEAIKMAEEKLPTNNGREFPSLDLARARLLCFRGDKEGEALFDRYAEQIKDEVDPYWVQRLLVEEMRAGSKERAFAHAAKALSVAEPKKSIRNVRELVYLATLFPQRATTAEIGWAALRRQFKDESPAEVLKRLRQRMEGKIAAAELKKWIEEDKQSGIGSLAEIALHSGLDDFAVSLLKKADSRDALLRLGDLLAAKKQWQKAAQRYRQAWTRPEKPRSNSALAKGEREIKSRDPLPLYLAGDALVRAGQKQEGKKLIEQAHALPFADADVRYHFIDGLNKRGYKEAARRETELMLRVSAPHSYYSNDAFRRLAFAAQTRKDYRTAAENLEKWKSSCINGFFWEHADYINLPALTHTYWAMELLAAGKLDEALVQVEVALADSPGYVDVPILLVPELERRGHKKEASALFARCHAAYEKVCRDYPRCAWTHNAAAWMSACCRRNLDKALQHADKAVELAPTNAGYLDTLAEVHFQRGAKEKAIVLQKRAIELDPKKSYFRKQLKRLEAGNPNAERPPQNDE